MSISSISANPGSTQIGAIGGRSTVRQARQDFEQLFQSMQSGNLSAAQQAYADLQQLRTAAVGSATASAGSTAATDNSTAATASATANPVITDWTALGQALQSGSLSTAQDALSKLKQDATTQWQSEMQNAKATYALMQGTASGNTSTSAVGAVSNDVQTDLNNLSQSLQSGDTAGAQKLLAKLEQDLQSSGQSTQMGHHHHHHHGGFASQSQASSYAANAVTPTAATASTASTASSGSSGGSASSTA